MRWVPSCPAHWGERGASNAAMNACVRDQAPLVWRAGPHGAIDAAMPDLPMALTGVPTHELEQLLRLVHHQKIELPITPVSLAFAGLQHRSAEIMQSLRGLDEKGARAVLVAVLAERKQA